MKYPFMFLENYYNDFGRFRIENFKDYGNIPPPQKLGAKETRYQRSPNKANKGKRKRQWS